MPRDSFGYFQADLSTHSTKSEERSKVLKIAPFSSFSRWRDLWKRSLYCDRSGTIRDTLVMSLIRSDSETDSFWIYFRYVGLPIQEKNFRISKLFRRKNYWRTMTTKRQATSSQRVIDLSNIFKWAGNMRAKMKDSKYTHNFGANTHTISEEQKSTFSRLFFIKAEKKLSLSVQNVRYQ